MSKLVALSRAQAVAKRPAVGFLQGGRGASTPGGQFWIKPEHYLGCIQG